MLAKPFRFNLKNNNLNFSSLKWFKTTGLSIGVGATENDLTQVGIIITKKIDKSAVVRNQLKRRLYQAVADVFDLKTVNRILIVRTFPEVLNISFDQIKQNLEEIRIKSNQK